MVKEFFKWLGALMVAEVGAWLAWRQVATGLPWWSQWIALGVVVAIGFLPGLPIGREADGSTRRVFRLAMRGRDASATTFSGDSPTVTGPIVTGKKNTIIVVAQPQAEEISKRIAQSEVLPDTRAIPTPETKASVEQVLNQRFGELTDKLMHRINEEDPMLDNRFADPRFLAPLASAHRACAETGSEELSDTLAGLLTDVASQPVRSRKEELGLRQALDVAPR